MAEIPGLVGHRLGFYRRPCEAVAKKACQPKTNTDLKNSYNRPHCFHARKEAWKVTVERRIPRPE
ncbi:MAG: hypothetical protein R3F31_17510 [Verrucomicrobiales bacterium]